MTSVDKQASTAVASHVQTVHSSEADVQNMADHIRITFRRPPCRFTVLSWNCSELRLNKSFGSVLDRLQPDILCVQRLTASISKEIDAALPSHNHVTEQMGKGWGTDCHIYWSHWFEREQSGEEILPSGASLYYVQLRDRTSASGRFIVTSLFLPGGNCDFSKNRDHLARISRQLPALMCISVEDAHNAFGSLKKSGLRDCFSSLGLPLRPTYPQRPASIPDADQVLDYVCHVHGNLGRLRPMMAQVLENITAEEGPPRTVHMPVSVCYELLPPESKQGWEQTRPPAAPRVITDSVPAPAPPPRAVVSPKKSSNGRASLTTVDEDSETGDVILARSVRGQEEPPSPAAAERYGYGSFYGVSLGSMGDYFGFGPKAPSSPNSSR